MTTKRKRKFSQDFSGVSKTDRSFGPACDVNAIVRHYEQTGIDPYISRKAAEQFGDVSSQNYLEAMRTVADVNSAFAELPSAERHAHSNDPQQWIEHLNTPPDPEPEIAPPAPSPEAPEPVPPDPDTSD